MGLNLGWVTDAVHELTSNQQIAALGNRVMALHARAALEVLSGGAAPVSLAVMKGSCVYINLPSGCTIMR